MPRFGLEGARIALVAAAASRIGGGVFEAIVTQANLIRDLGGDVEVFALQDRFSEVDRYRFSGIPVHTAPIIGPRQIGYSRELSGMLLRYNADIVHSHGVWMHPSAAAADWARKHKRPYIISTHGMIDPWITNRGRFKKALAKFGYEHRSWKTATAFHALTVREKKDIEDLCGAKRVFVIPNAGPDPSDISSQRDRSFLYLGRIHPKKNYESLLLAWKERSAALEAVGATLLIAGWGEDNHMAHFHELMRDMPSSVSFLGSVYGERKQALLESANFFVLPTFSEGLPMAVLEAWAAGTPSLMTADCNLPVGFEKLAALESGVKVSDIGNALVEAANLSEHRWSSMSEAAKSLAKDAFSRSAVNQQWCTAYKALLGRKA